VANLKKTWKFNVINHPFDISEKGCLFSRADMKINLYDADKAELYLKNLKVKDAGRLSTKLNQLEAPDMNESKIKFKLLHVESPSSFWIEREDQEERHVSLMQMIRKNIDKCLIVERLEFIKV